MNDSEILASRVLIIDDEPVNVELLEQILQREGFHHVVSTTEPDRALEIYRAMQPHLVLLDLRMPVAEVPTAYGARPAGSESKLNTWVDGWRILRMIIRLLKAEKPLQFFSVLCVACLLLAGFLALPVLAEYLRTGLVPRFPTAILCMVIVLFGAILLACGIVLDTVTRGRTEMKRFAYLAQPSSFPLAKNG